MTKTETESGPRLHTRATMGNWNLDNDGAITRMSEHIAHFSEEGSILVYDSQEISRQYRLPVTNLLRKAGLEVKIKRSREYEEPPADAPERPDISNSPWGIYDPRNVRWLEKFAYDEFVVTFGVIPGDRVKMPVLIKDVDFYWRRKAGAGYQSREYGERVKEYAMKYPAYTDTVLTYKAATAPTEQEAEDIDFDIKY